MLPNGMEPLVLADGTRINPVDGVIIEDEFLVEVPNTEDIKREIVAARKRISDLPVPPNQMNTISVIISYTLFKSSDSYRSLQEQFVKNIMESDASDVRNMFVQKSKTAAHTMFALMESNNEATRGSAAKDILDRAGQRPVDVIEHRHRMEGGLTIEYVEKKDDIPIIDITADL